MVVSWGLLLWEDLGWGNEKRNEVDGCDGVRLVGLDFFDMRRLSA